MKKILIVDCESQYTKLIAKCVRNLNQYCEIVHHSKFTYNFDDVWCCILRKLAKCYKRRRRRYSMG